jgi:hypothetical protein
MSRLGEGRRRQVGAQLAVLEREFGGRVPADHIVATSDRVLEGLLDSARITDFIPVLTYRYTRETLRAEERSIAA